jgi:phage gp36-like protein
VYASAQDLRDRYPDQDLIQLTDPEGQILQVDRLDSALRAAQSIIDGYLQGRYPLPLAQVPSSLVEYACDIAMYRLQTLRPADTLEDARARYKDAIKYLEQVSRGELQLGLSQEQQPAPQSGGPELIAPDRNFSRDSMRGY